MSRAGVAATQQTARRVVAIKKITLRPVRAHAHAGGSSSATALQQTIASSAAAASSAPFASPLPPSSPAVAVADTVPHVSPGGAALDDVTDPSNDVIEATGGFAFGGEAPVHKCKSVSVDGASRSAAQGRNAQSPVVQCTSAATPLDTGSTTKGTPRILPGADDGSTFHKSAAADANSPVGAASARPVKAAASVHTAPVAVSHVNAAATPLTRRPMVTPPVDSTPSATPPAGSAPVDTVSPKAPWDSPAAAVAQLEALIRDTQAKTAALDKRALDLVEPLRVRTNTITQLADGPAAGAAAAPQASPAQQGRPSSCITEKTVTSVRARSNTTSAQQLEGPGDVCKGKTPKSITSVPASSSNLAAPHAAADKAPAASRKNLLAFGSPV